MPQRVAVSLVVLWLALLFPRAAAAVAGSRCHMCGMDAAKSQTEFVMEFEDGAVEHTCCLHCVLLLRGFLKGRKESRLLARDFASGELGDARRASYVEGSSRIPKGSMAPFLLAFAERKRAEEHVARFGGRIVDLAAAIRLVEQFEREMED